MRHARPITRVQVDRELLFLVGLVVTLPLCVDIVASYLSRDWTNLSRIIAIGLAYYSARRSESHKLRRERLKPHA